MSNMKRSSNPYTVGTIMWWVYEQGFSDAMEEVVRVTEMSSFGGEKSPKDKIAESQAEIETK